MEARLTREEVPDLLDEVPHAAQVFLHLRVAGANLGLQALTIRLHLQGGFLGSPGLQTHSKGQEWVWPQEHISPAPKDSGEPAPQDLPGKHL